jgi:hypothetical protein
MSRTDKLYNRLEHLETELHQCLMRELRDMKETGNGWILDTPETIPYMSSWWFKKEPLQNILHQVCEIESLREKLQEPSEEGIAYLYRKYASMLNDKGNEQRLGPKRIAEQFLGDLAASIKNIA